MLWGNALLSAFDTIPYLTSSGPPNLLRHVLDLLLTISLVPFQSIFISYTILVFGSPPCQLIYPPSFHPVLNYAVIPSQLGLSFRRSVSAYLPPSSLQRLNIHQVTWALAHMFYILSGPAFHTINWSFGAVVQLHCSLPQANTIAGRSRGAAGHLDPEAEGRTEEQGYNARPGIPTQRSEGNLEADWGDRSTNKKIPEDKNLRRWSRGSKEREY